MRKLFFALSALICTSANATILISKDQDSHLNSVHQYIMENPYQSFQDDIIVVDMASGNAEKFIVDHNYYGEFYTSIIPAPLSNQEKTVSLETVKELENAFDRLPSSTYNIPEWADGLQINTVNLASKSYVKQSVEKVILDRLLPVISKALSNFQYISANETVSLKVPPFYLSDGTKIILEIQYNRYHTIIKVLSIIDKDGNIIPLDKDEASNLDYRFINPPTGFVEIFVDYLKELGIQVRGNINYHNTSRGKVVIIDCNIGGCTITE